MKTRTLLFVFANLLIATSLIAQDPIVIPGGADNGGKLETIINADTTADGLRNNPNQVYELEAGQFYLQHAPIIVNNPDGTIIIRGQEGGRKPVMIRYPLEEVNVGTNQVNSSLTLQNIQIHNMQPDNYIRAIPWNISGDNHHLLVEDCMVEHCRMMFIDMNNVQAGAEIEIRNCYFRDFQDGSSSQWWSGRVVQCKVPVDTLIFENNTITGSGLTILGHGSLFEYAVINHNTFINNRKYPTLNQYWKEVYFTNNLFVNTNWVGEDHENVASGGQDPDALLHGLSGVDTITTDIWMNPKFITEDSTLTDDIDEISDYIFYAADNVVVYSSTLDNYYSGGLSPDWDDAPSSYLTWGGVDGPFKVVNVPAIWANERTVAMVADWDNLKDENNSIYEISVADLGMVTDPLPQDAANSLIQWNRNKWGVPDVESPNLDVAQFGDYDPTTIPGVEVEAAPAGEGGITKISDMIEDFSYTASLVSKSDGLRIGALHWNDEVYDGAASLAAVKNAYNGIYIGIDDPVVVFESEFDLKNYPNPFNSSTTIRFNLPQDSHVNLSVFDISGRLVETLVDENRAGGIHTVQFTPDNAASSTYFYKLTTDYNTATRKMMLLK